MGNGKRILVVDDEHDALEYAKTVLESGEYEVRTTDNAEKGLEEIQNWKPDAAILDIQMPGKDGFWLFDKMARSPDLSEVKVIMLTGIKEKSGIGFDADVMDGFFGKGPEHYVEKPIDPDQLLETVAKVLGLQG